MAWISVLTASEMLFRCDGISFQLLKWPPMTCQNLRRASRWIYLIFFLIFSTHAKQAYAQYPSVPPETPVRYWFSTTVGYYNVAYAVASRMDICTSWMKEQNPKPPSAPTWTNPRLPASLSPGTGNFGKTMFVHVTSLPYTVTRIRGVQAKLTVPIP
jgi:hypothetical protein